MSRNQLPRNLVVGSFAAAAVFALAGRALSATANPEHGSAPASATPAKTAAPAKAKATAPAAESKTTGKGASVASGKGEANGNSAAPGERAAGTNTNTNNDKNEGPAGGESRQSAAMPGADEALSWLEEGNARWVSAKTQSPNTSADRRAEVAGGQHPFVTILTCADSRLPVERIFDRGVGDVFVVRVAGAVAGGSETGTIEYGVEHLKTPLLVVMGHTKCGAVAAAAANADVHGKVAELVSHIKPAVDRARKANPESDANALATVAVKENVWQSIFDLYKTSEGLRQSVSGGKLKVIGAVYDVASGKVEFMGEHPWQAALLNALSDDKATANAESEQRH